MHESRKTFVLAMAIVAITCLVSTTWFDALVPDDDMPDMLRTALLGGRWLGLIALVLAFATIALEGIEVWQVKRSIRHWQRQAQRPLTPAEQTWPAPDRFWDIPTPAHARGTDRP